MSRGQQLRERRNMLHPPVDLRTRPVRHRRGWLRRDAELPTMSPGPGVRAESFLLPARDLSARRMRDAARWLRRNPRLWTVPGERDLLAGRHVLRPPDLRRELRRSAGRLRWDDGVPLLTLARDALKAR